MHPFLGAFIGGSVCLLAILAVFVAALVTRESVASQWLVAQNFSGGKWLFSTCVAFVAPYSASVSPHVVELDTNRCVVKFKEWWFLRNPFRSIHLAALVNGGELAGGLSVLYALSYFKSRCIVKTVHAEYFKKARGWITSTSTTEIPTELGKHEVDVVSELTDSSGDKVATVTIKWLIDVHGVVPPLEKYRNKDGKAGKAGKDKGKEAPADAKKNS